MNDKWNQQNPELRGSEIVALVLNEVFEQHIQEENMAIIIQNIDENPRDKGEHKYQLRINREVVCEFTHLREEGLAQCLRRAAEAVDEHRGKK